MNVAYEEDADMDIYNITYSRLMATYMLHLNQCDGIIIIMDI